MNLINPPKLPPPIRQLYPKSDNPYKHAWIIMISSCLLMFLLLFLAYLFPWGDVQSVQAPVTLPKNESTELNPTKVPTGEKKPNPESKSEGPGLKTAYAPHIPEALNDSGEHADANPIVNNNDTGNYKGELNSGSHENEIEQEGNLLPTPGQATIGIFSQSEAQMFGIKSKGNHIAYVIDRSGSMGTPVHRLDAKPTEQLTIRAALAGEELLKSVKRLKSTQKFSVVFFDTGYYFDKRFIDCPATTNNKRELEEWVRQMPLGGGTDPAPAMQLILRNKEIKPDAIFLLSDGEFYENAVTFIQSANTQRTFIHTISLEVDSQTLRDIATQNGGQYVLHR